MPEYVPGVPMWVDFSSSDIEKSRAFYKNLFGWEAEIPPEGGGYTLFFLNGKMVAGGGPTFSPDQHPAWSTYVCSDNADATAQAAKDAGGQVVHGPMEVMDQGRMAVMVDPTGAPVSIWQPQAHTGAQVVNEIGSWGWSELYTRDLPTDVAFYEKVFGWTSEETDMDSGKYTLFKVGDRPVAGGMDMSFLPADVPPHWLVYFVVENTDQSVAKAKELGAKVLAGPQPTPMGPMAVLDDPVDAAFAIIQINQPSS